MSSIIKVKFADGSEHELGKPSFKTLETFREANVEFEDLKVSDLPMIIHALIKRANPSFDKTADDIADLLDADLQSVQTYMGAVLTQFGMALPEADESAKTDEASTEVPTKGRAGSKRP